MNPAFAFIYEDALHDPKWERERLQLEAELGRLGIEGSIAWVSTFQASHQLIQDFIRRRVTNIVLVGSDNLFLTTVPHLINLPVVTGFVPFGQSLVGGLLGMPSGVSAAEVIAARLVEALDIGIINERPFLLEVSFPQTTACLEMDGFRLRPSWHGGIAVRNLSKDVGLGLCSDPTDGLLEVVMQAEIKTAGIHWPWQAKERSETKMWMDKGRITDHDVMKFFVDGLPMQASTCVFSIIPNVLHLVVGRRMGHELAKPVSD